VDTISRVDHDRECGWERLDPSAWDRIRARTSARVNERIDRAAASRVARARTEPTAGLLRRLAELDREWDVDRALMANFAILGGLSFALGVSRSNPWRRRNPWLALFGTQLGFLLFHSVAGWCPPLPVFRRLGFRTQKEIDVERHCVERLLRQRNEQLLGTTETPMPAPQ
jgi:hypothetical protein